MQESNNANSDVPVDDREQLYCVAKQCQINHHPPIVTRVVFLEFIIEE